jgi:D-alanyl-lipoteichoic acid acyltransferase DltB (MBOAT superfamily)
MLFNSFSFLFCFALLAAGYYALPPTRRWPLLLVASLGFYATFRASYLLLLLGITGVSYVGGRALSAASTPRALLVFKYYDFLAPAVFPRLGIVVAVGLSFYTFSCVSYLADVYAGRLPPERHFGYFALYVSFFPKLLAGPIERAGPFLSQVRKPVVFDSAGVTLGLQLMLWGLFKKVVIADRLAPFVDSAYALPAFTSPADLVLGTYFFAFQLYCDFSGYSDMAIGAAKVLGIDLAQNFRRPYFSTSVPEFWAQRWHLSLAGWFRDYMYIPLGGSRGSRLRRYANVLAVFLVSG